MLNQEEINRKFTQDIDAHNNRERFMAVLPKSGFPLIKKIPVDADILDVGCGKNLFKEHFPNLIGIDPIGTQADYNLALLDYTTDKKFDVVLCLGSIFGTLDDIRLQITHIKSMLKPGGKIYWRNHPAKPEWRGFPGCKYGPFPDWFYPWTEQTHEQLAQEFNFTINEIDREMETLKQDALHEYRIYAEWTLNS